MDRHSPPFYIEDTDHGCQEMEVFVQHVLGMTAVGRAHLHACVDENGIIVSRPCILSVLEGVYVCTEGVNKKSILDRADTPLVLPIITPRFVPTCSELMMKKLGQHSNVIHTYCAYCTYLNNYPK